MVLVIGSFLIFSGDTSELVFRSYTEQPLEVTKIRNLVSSIYLDFRLFDTIFEALLLLVSIGAIFLFTTLTDHEKRVEIHTFEFEEPNTYNLPRIMMSVVYPLLFIFGIYMIINGADSPGGGFQGGAILASILMSRYIVEDNYEYSYQKPYNYEKAIYIFVILTSALYLAGVIPSEYLRLYILMMNILIALKVASGFSAIFIKFINGNKNEWLSYD